MAIRDHIIAIIKWAFLTEMAWALKTTTTYKSINSLLLLIFRHLLLLLLLVLYNI